MTPYPTFDDDPERWGLEMPEPMTEEEAQAASNSEAWGGQPPQKPEPEAGT